MHTITLLHFAQLREARGVAEERATVAPGTTLADLYRSLFPGALAALPVGYARNAVIARGADVICDGDEIAFLPPVGGG